jgi:hypothetical protein
MEQQSPLSGAWLRRRKRRRRRYVFSITYTII